MGSDVAIRIEGLGKRYRLGQTIDLARNFRETLQGLPRYVGERAAGAVRKLVGSRGKPATWEDPETPPGTFWALRDVSFEVKRGEAIGIIGRNGAGKSTLLKILSRITTPTKGRAEIHGRVGSLLEVGTGFHPELSGRENIYLNGSILGMRKTEIEKKFDEIVAFAEVEKFLDTPVKRYSSGMRVRLAFAVAAHLEPEILVIDEVLAVGDAQFQKKCLGKMDDVTKGGRTVLFVSHNMGAIDALCPRTVILHSGCLALDASTGESLRFYSHSYEPPSIPLGQRTDRKGNGDVRAESIHIMNQEQTFTSSIGMGESFTVELQTSGSLRNAIVGIIIGTLDRKQMIRGYTCEQMSEPVNLVDGSTIRCTFKRFPMMHGEYEIHVWLGRQGEVADGVENAASLTVEPRDIYGVGRPPDPKGGVAFCDVEWEIGS